MGHIIHSAGPFRTCTTLAALGAAVFLSSSGAEAQGGPPAGACEREISADVVALDHAVQFNRYGSHHPAWMIYALRQDVVSKNGSATLTPGNVRLRDEHRPRPLVLRVNRGDCLTIKFQNLLSPSAIEEVAGVSADQPATRMAGLQVTGLSYTRGPQDAGSHVGANASSQVTPGASTVYRLHASHEGTFPFFNQAATVGGEANTGTMAFGMFGAVHVQPKGAEWYRSQVTRADLDLATERGAGGAPVLLSTGHPKINYDATYPAGHPLAGRPILAMLRGTELVHGDLHAIITGANRGNLEAMAPNPVLEPNRDREQGLNAGARPRNEPYREFTIMFHDEVKAIQAFPQFSEDPVLGYTLHGVGDAFGINYGVTGVASQVLANRLGVGPAAHCAECKYEEFFLTSWAGNDPALVTDVPASAALKPDGTVDPAIHATRALYPADPGNVFPSYLGDRLRMRNLHIGAEQHIFHLHAHQWLANPESTGSSYLDSQFIAPGTGRTYEIAYNGSGNRNQTVGDSIFHCHLYPHFAQGMWGLWRVHDTFEWGTPLDNEGKPLPMTRANPDGEIPTGTPIYALVPVPGMALAPLPAPVHIANGQPVIGSGTAAEDNPGFPFFVAGRAGHRPPRAPFESLHDGGLPRHVVLSGEAIAQLDRLDLDKVSESLEVKWLAEDGEPSERAAMAFHERRTHDSVTHDGTARAFVTNGRPRVRGAPFADPCRTDFDEDPSAMRMRTYKGAAIQLRMVLNRAGWHYPQARMAALWEDVNDYVSGARAPEPLVIRVHSGDCVEYQHANLVPQVYELDDYQVRTPTDIIGQHIHLVKFDVTASDGSGNGWNYEDGTLAPGEVRERIAAIRRHNLCAEGATGQNCPLAVPHPFFGAGPNNEYLGAMTTVQRWYADPVTDETGKDRSLGSVFSHDHFGPSTHQQNGLYSSVVIEPRNSTWLRSDSDETLHYTRADGGPTSWSARIITENGTDSFREFNLQVADFVQAYAKGGGVDSNGRPIPDPARVINGPARQGLSLPNPYLIGRANDCPGGVPLPCPQAISVQDTGTFTVNYRNEPLALRIFNPNLQRADGSGNGAQATGRAGDLAYAFRSDVTRAMPEFNAQPGTYPALTPGLSPGDPWTPMLRTYKRDRIQIRLLTGAHEEPHIAQAHGMRWLANADDRSSGWRSAQQLGISEHFEMQAQVVPPEGDLAATVDHLYAASGGIDGFWNGTWGLMRSHEFQQTNLRPLPNNVPPARRTVDTGAGTVSAGVTSVVTNLAEFSGVCPRTAPTRRYSVSAVAANQVVGATGIVYNSRPGNYAGQRGPIVDPQGAFYVLDSDLSAGKLVPGRTPEPLVLRAAAGDCIEVTLTNRLPANWANQVVAPANHNYMALPPIVDNFNANQVKPSMEVGLHAQLVTTDLSRSDGANVGLNASIRNGVRTTSQTAASGQSVTYRWYAGLLREEPVAAGQVRLVAEPVEFGGVNLMPADPIRQSGKGLVGALVVLPQGSAWVEDPATRTQASVMTPSGRSFRDLVLVAQDDLSLRAANKPICMTPAGGEPDPGEEPQSIAVTGCSSLDDAQDAGHYGYNFRTEPMWTRMGHPPGENFEITNRLDYSQALSNAKVRGNPSTPVFTARAGEELRFRVLQAGGHTRTGTFTLMGHSFAERPYSAGTVVPSQTIEGQAWQSGYRRGQWIASREGVGPGNHFDVVVEQAGGPFRVAGDYLFRNMFPLGFEGGQWGILRVTR